MASIAINPANTWIPKKSTNVDLSDYVTKDLLTNIYTYKGSVDNYEDLPTENLISGDVWNVENDYTSVIDNKYYPAGTNWVWNGSEWDALGGNQANNQMNNLIEITYSELKSLRDNSQLSPGSFYRITDYVTTTTQSETKSANHPFDVIVLALSENTLCEDAKAILHEGDTYFANSDLSVWELKYCLDNDKTRFYWADEANGKGVIYRMIDEKRNDCPYDFKNILFYNIKFTDYTTSDRYYYTFSYVVRGVLYDGTTEKQVNVCYGNAMNEYRVSGVLRLNKNVFRNTYFMDRCYSNTFGNNCYSNTFGYSCQYNIFGNNCFSNVFGFECYSNVLGNECSSNTFNPRCSNNTLVNYCCNNVLGAYCGYNTLGSGCCRSILKDGLQYHYLDANKTSFTLNEEFYDDGSGQLVPIKHPDLSTQPSILPYKFMGQYVYEQLIPWSIINFTNGNYILPFDSIIVQKPLFLSATLIGDAKYYDVFNEPASILKGSNGFVVKPSGAGKNSPPDSQSYLYVKIVYTSMPEESDYYGYNNY